MHLNIPPLWAPRNPIKNRAMLAYNRANVGRGGEIYFSSWKTTSWCYEEDVFETETFQPKTGRITRVCLARDKTEWALDPLVMLAAMLIVDPASGLIGDGDDDENFIFPTLHLLTYKSVANLLNDYIKNISKEGVEGLDQKAASHDIRFGALADCQANDDLQLIYAIIKGGWQFQGDSTGMWYADKRPAMIEAARALAGYKNTKEVPALPDAMRCNLIDENFEDDFHVTFENFAASLFERLPFSKKGERNYNLRNVFLGAIIEKLPKIIADLKVLKGDEFHQDSLERIVRSELVRHQFTWEEFLGWSAKVIFFFNHAHTYAP